MESYESDENESFESDQGNDSSNGDMSVCQLNDKLKSIRPFSESQLMDLYSNDQLRTNSTYIDTFLRVRTAFKTAFTYLNLHNFDFLFCFSFF